MNSKPLSIGLVLALIVLAVPAAFSQVGISLGLARSSVELADSSYGRSQYVDGLSARVSLARELASGVVLKPSVSYAHRGGKYPMDTDSTNGDSRPLLPVSISADIVDAAFLAEITASRSPKRSAAVILGPQVGWVIESSVEKDSVLTSGWMTGSDFAFVAGIGLGFKGDVADYFLEILYRHALSGIDQDLGAGALKFSGFSTEFGVLF